MEQQKNQGNDQSTTKKPTKATTKNKPRVLSVRVSYEDYGKLCLECDSAGDHFADYVRSKLTRDAAAEANERRRVGDELAKLRAQLKAAQEQLATKTTEATKSAQNAEKLQEQLATSTKDGKGLRTALKVSQDELAAKATEATKSAQNAKKLQEQLAASTNDQKALKSSVKELQGQLATQGQELEKVRKNAAQSAQKAAKDNKMLQEQLAAERGKIQAITIESNEFQTRLNQANAYLAEKAKGILGDKLIQF